VIAQDELRSLLKLARTIAVVGLSPKPIRPSNSVARYLQRLGYTIVPINPGHDTILGEKSYANLAAAAKDHTIDIVNIFRRSEHAGAVVDEALALHPRPQLIWLQQGVIDAGAEVRAAAAGVPFVMDQCLAIEHSHLEAR
jgi:uncharacterized protein